VPFEKVPRFAREEVTRPSRYAPAAPAASRG